MEDINSNRRHFHGDMKVCNGQMILAFERHFGATYMSMTFWMIRRRLEVFGRVELVWDNPEIIFLIFKFLIIVKVKSFDQYTERNLNRALLIHLKVKKN